MAVFTNQATLSYNGIVTSSNIVSGELVQVLSVSKTALERAYSVGDTVTYTLGIINSGTTPYTGLTVTDDLGAYEFDSTTLYPLNYVDGSLVYLVNGSELTASAVIVGPPLIINGVTVPAGGNVTLIYEAEVNSFAPLAVGDSINNTVTVSGGGLPDNIIAEATIDALSEPELTISKALCPAIIPENGALTYTFVIQNSGNTAAVATDNVTVSDLFDPILNITSVTLDGAPLSLGTGYTYNQATGLFETVPSVITVPAATYTQNEDGSYTVVPGVATLVVSGTI
jgi:uncharacterized repeat protein (TIGR01451 family)